jgi:ATP-dependent RNA helicase DeaD
MDSFQDTGIRQDLLGMIEELDLDRPSSLQAASIPLLRRGGNLVIRGSSGSGKTLAYGLAILDRLAPDAGEDGEDGGAEETRTRAVVVRPTREDAERAALTLQPFAAAVGWSVTVAGSAWGLDAPDAEMVFGTPAALLERVAASALKLDAVEALVVDGAAALQTLGELPGLDTLLDQLPRAAQRILVTATVTPELSDLVERRVRKAMHFPPEAAVAGEAETPPARGELGYVVSPQREKLEILARLLRNARGTGAPPSLFCRTDERAADVAEALAQRGFAVGDEEDEEREVAVVASAASREELGDPTRTISFDVPLDEQQMIARHDGDDAAAVLVAARELPHLRELSRRAGFVLRSIPAPLPEGEEALARFRGALRRAMEEEDLSAEILLLEPLLEEYSAVEVAAAAASLLRRRSAPLAAEPQAAAPAARSASASAPSAGGKASSITRLYFGVGSRDGARPGDLVGAITGETKVKGSQVGRIEIRDTFSLVEVEAAVADEIIRGVNGTTVKGRAVRVDVDRGKAASQRRVPVRRSGARPPRGD